MRILVADDHTPVRRFVCSVLEAEGWEVCGQAANGREAVEMAFKMNPDIIVLDLSMPELSGLDAARQILKKLPQTQVLILTLHDCEDLSRAIVEAGVGACLLKTNLQYLVTEVHALFQSGRRRRHPADVVPQVPPPTTDDDVAQQLITRLTTGERNILKLLARSKTNKEIAVALSISVNAVESSRSTIMGKLGVDSIVDCVRYARKTF